MGAKRIALLLFMAAIPALAQQRTDTVVTKPTLLSPCGVSYVEAIVTSSQLVRVPVEVLGTVPCSDTAVLPRAFRAQVRCTLVRMDHGGWHAMVYETYRSDQRQRYLYSFGRTRPGIRVTNASSVYTSVHGYYLATDIIDRFKGWDNPRFFRWLGVHAESCGLTAGIAWQSFPDAPHIQTGVWAGAPPTWARTMLLRDSVHGIWARLGQS